MVRILIFLFLLSVEVHAFDVEVFESGMAKHGAIYDNFASLEETKTLFIEGKVSESNQRLIELVSDDKKTVYDYFILGNMLFENDFETSYELMRKAEKKEPDNPYVLYERGIHEHRLGNYSVAKTYYKRIQKTDIAFSKHVLNAYLTHTYLMTGEPEEAFIAWQRANFGRNHTSIEKAMYTIFSNTNQVKKRESLLFEINQGAKLKLCDLYYLDSEWEIDWWNYQPKKTYLEYDKNLALGILERGSLAEKYFSLCSSGKKIDDQAYIERLHEIGLFKNNAKLPESSTLVYEILRKLISTKSMKPEEFIVKFESNLIELSKRYPNDRKYFDVLAFLYANVGNQEKLKDIDYYGWKKLKIEKFALSYIAGIDPQSESYESVFKEALEDFPLSIRLNQYRLSIDTKNKKDALLKFVASQFANVKNNWSGPYRLNDYMASLRHELDKLKN
ncbi:tetratricopeptide repeat protein [Zooshikella sp. RANM57]|uniref:tetratricopeptide repeat protein n=1 Tax=Zooshikella sp. RANM57 TaxID=3425863 RepID=UPI003D6EE665